MGFKNQATADALKSEEGSLLEYVPGKEGVVVCAGNVR